jgi:O-antigen/teichoic acid export membrane protein
MAETGKSFVKKFVGFSMVTWVSFALKFLSAPISTRLFVPEVLGKINIFNTYTNLFGTLVLIGLDQAFARFYLERPNNRSKGYLFTFCFGITYALLSFVIILSVPIRDFLSWQLFQETDNLLLYLFFVSVFCSSTLRYLNLSYRMEKNIKMYTIQGILMTLVSKILYIGVGFWDASYKPALIVLTVSHFVLAIVFLLIQHNRFELIYDYDRHFTREMFKYAIPLIPVSVLMWANTSIPQIVMQKTMDYHSIGIFTSAVALANIILIIQSGFNIFWLPYTYENYKTQTGQFFKVHRYLLCVLTIFALLIILSQDVVFLILGEKYREAKCFFPFLILPPVCYIIAETTGMGIDISKKTYFNIVVFGCSVVVNIIFCLLLKSLLGVPGIAMAVALAGLTSMWIKTYIGQKYYRAVDNYRYIYLTVGLILASSFITLYVQTLSLKLLLLLLFFFCSVLSFRKEIMELMKFALSFRK